MLVKLPEMDAYTLGYVIYFFEIAVGMSGYLNGVTHLTNQVLKLTRKTCLLY